MKKFLALAMAAAMSLSLVACGGSSAAPAASEAAPAPDAAPAASEEAAAPEAEGGFSYDGKPVTLTVSQHDPESSATGQFLNDLKATLDAETNGAIQLDIYHGGALIASPKETLQGVTDGVCDIGFGLCSYYAGTLDRSNVCGIPGLGIPDAGAGSKAEWAVYQSGLLDEEYANYHMLLLWANCKSPISTVDKQIASLDDLKGLKVRANSGPTTIMTTEVFGCEPFGCPIGELTQNLQTGAAGACVTDWHGVDSFQVYEVCKKFLDGDFGCSAYWLLMNQASYDNLDPALQGALDSICAAQIDGIGQYWDDAEASGRAAAEAAGGEIYTLADEAALTAAFEQVKALWIEDIDAAYGAGAGQALVDTFVGALK